MGDVETIGNIEPDDEDPPHTDISDETAEKIHFSVNNSVIGIVKAINEETVGEYSDFIERHFPVDDADWPTLCCAMVTAARKGPKIFVKCSRGKISGYKKLDNIKIVAFVKQQNEKVSKHKEIEGEVKDYTESDVDFTLDDYLMTPAFDDCVIRVEVRKLRRKDINSRVLVGFTEIPIRDVPSTTIESYYELQKSGVEGLKKISLPSNDPLGHLVLTLSRDESEVDPNIAVPNLIKQYFIEKAKDLFNKTLPSTPAKIQTDPVSYQLIINQNTNPNRNLGQAYFQKLVTEDGVYPRNESGMATYSIDCVLTNRVELGVEVRRRSVSPGQNTLLTPQSHKRSSSLSPSQSMISLMTSGRRESAGSNSSLLSISNENTPKKKKSSNMLGILNKTIGSIGEDLYDMVSPTNKPTIKTISIDKLVSSLHQHKNSNQTIEENEAISWDTKMEIFSSVKLNSDELNVIYENAIIESIKKCEEESWDGTFSKTISSLLNMINCFVDAKRKDVNLSTAEAYLKAHSTSYFCDSILRKHIETIVKSETQSENLDKYVKKCLKVIESHRCDQSRLRIPMILENLKKISNKNEEVSFNIEKCVKAGVTRLFSSWERDLTKKLVEKAPTSTNISIQVCRDILNIHIFQETQAGYKAYQDLFSGILNYQQVTGQQYVELCKDMLKNSLPEKEKKILLKYDENSPRVKALLLVYETFCAFKRIFDNMLQKYPDWLFDIYKQYPDLWVELAIYKAEDQVENLLKHVRENEERFHEIESASCDKKTGGLSRENSVDDITNETLQSFYGITETCWKFRKELRWPSIDVNLSTGLQLIEGLAKLETRILNLFESIHMKDEEYDALELSRTIKLLDGLLKRHHSTVDEVALLHSKIADEDDMNEVDQEYFKTKMSKCYELIQKVKDKTKEEILNKIDLYCIGRRPKIKKYILDKALVVNEGECLMKCIDDELHLMYKNIPKKYHSDVMGALWKVMEEELELQFKDRKQRNLSKNKPARFCHFKDALPVIIDFKKGMHEDGIILEFALDTLSIMYKEVTILTEDSRILLNKVLRMKAQAQKIDLDENGNNSLTKTTSMALKLAYVTGSDKIMIEVVNIHNIIPRENKNCSRVQVYTRLTPDRMGSGQQIEHTSVFEDVDRSIIFDLQGEPVRFEFDISHLTAKKEFEDGFLIVNLFHVNKAGMKLSIGECVSQVKMNGMLVTEMVQISSESEFDDQDLVQPLNYQVEDFQPVYQSEVYQELHRRTSDHSFDTRAVMAKDDKVRKKSFFAKFS